MNEKSRERFCFGDLISDGSVKKFIKQRRQNFIRAEHLERYYFASRMAKGRKILDIACGTGYGSEMLAKSGAIKVVGADKDRTSVETSQKKYLSPNLKYILADAENLDLEEESQFDMIVSFETIEHLNDPEKFLDNIVRVLAPGGVLLISTPNRNISNPGTSLQDKPKNPYHVREYILEEFEDLLKKYFGHVIFYGQGGYRNDMSTVGKKIMRIRKTVLVGIGYGLKSVTQVKAIRNNWEPSYFLAVCEVKHDGK